MSLHYQLDKHIKTLDYFIYPTKEWTLQEYQEFFEYFEKGWIIQGDCYDNPEGKNGFIINPEWEDEPMWENEEEEYDGSVYIKKDGTTCFGCRTGGNPRCLCEEECVDEDYQEEKQKTKIEKLIPGIIVNKDEKLKPLPKEFIPDENNLKDMKKYKQILDKKNKDKKPKKRMMAKSGSKPDFLDFDKDGNTSESMKKALKDKKND